MAQMRIFLSYSHQDSDFARALAGTLRDAGADVWFDDFNMGAGNLMAEIERELAARPVFIVILSKAALASQWVRSECKWAYNLLMRDPARLILPVVASQLDPSDLDQMLFLESFRRVEASGWRPYPVSEAISRTLSLLQLTPLASSGAVASRGASPAQERVEDVLSRGDAAREQGNNEEALEAYDAATQLAPTLVTVWARKGALLSDMGRMQDSLDAFDMALQCDPNRLELWLSRASALRVLRRDADAVSAYERVLRRQPDRAEVWVLKGSALWNLHRYAEAIDAYKTALDEDYECVGDMTKSVRALIRRMG